MFGYKYVSFMETFILALITTFVIVRTSVFDNIFYYYYPSQSFLQFVIVVKCGVNRFAQIPEEKINIFITIFENLSKTILKPFFFSLLTIGILDLKDLFDIARFTIICTLVWENIPIEYFSKLRYLWAYLCIESLACIPYNLIQTINTVNLKLNGNLFMLFVMLYLESSLTLNGVSLRSHGFFTHPFKRFYFPTCICVYPILVAFVWYMHSSFYFTTEPFVHFPLNLSQLLYQHSKTFGGWFELTNTNRDHYMTYTISNYIALPFILICQMKFFNTLNTPPSQVQAQQKVAKKDVKKPIKKSEKDEPEKVQVQASKDQKQEGKKNEGKHKKKTK